MFKNKVLLNKISSIWQAFVFPDTHNIMLTVGSAVSVMIPNTIHIKILKILLYISYHTERNASIFIYLYKLFYTPTCRL